MLLLSLTQIKRKLFKKVGYFGVNLFLTQNNSWKISTREIFCLRKASLSTNLVCVCEPNQQCNLNKLPTELRCRNLVNKHRLSIQISPKRAKKCMQYMTTELPFCIPPLVVGKGICTCTKTSTHLSQEEEEEEEQQHCVLWPVGFAPGKKKGKMWGIAGCTGKKKYWMQNSNWRVGRRKIIRPGMNFLPPSCCC